MSLSRRSALRVPGSSWKSSLKIEYALHRLKIKCDTWGNQRFHEVITIITENKIKNYKDSICNYIKYELGFIFLHQKQNRENNGRQSRFKEYTIYFNHFSYIEMDVSLNSLT